MVNIERMDIAELLDNEQTMAEYLRLAAEDSNPDVFLSALGDVVRVKGISEIASKTGLGGESLYESLNAGGNPPYRALRLVMDALNIKFQVAPKEAGAG